MMDAIILAGGFGTRLNHIVSDVPKPMAPINKKPFLEYIFNYLIDNNIMHIVLAIGYKGYLIEDYFGNEYKGIPLSYSIEDFPLGTGGAIKKALDYCRDGDVFIINGDTYFDVNLNFMKVFHNKKKSKLTVAIKVMHDCDRYGTVDIQKDRITKFKEKKKIISGKINGGTYLINKSVFDDFKESSFSFEKLVLESGIVDLYAFESDGYFIDIGVPTDYYKAQEDFQVFKYLDVIKGGNNI